MTVQHKTLTGAELHQPFYIGLDANKAASPALGDHYYATDTMILYVCRTAGSWENFFATRPKRNFIINGGAMVNQRSTAYTLVKDTYGICADRFYGMATGTAVGAGTLTQDAASAIGRTGYAFKFAGVTLTGTGIIYLRYRMEARDALKLKNQTASFSCLALHDAGGAINYTVYVRKANTADNFSAVTAISNSGAQSIASGQAVAIKYEGISMGDCSTGVEIEIKVECGAITTKNFSFTEIKFELGAKATEFEHVSYQEAEAECLRYCQILWTGTGVATGTTALNIESALYAPMRATPVVTAPTVLTITDTGSNFPQSTPNVTFDFSGTNRAYARFGNFTGLTTGKIYFLTGGYIQLEAEL